VAPTCNRFDKEYVERQWRCALAICNSHLGHVVGMACGNDSDGDARRRSLQQVAMLRTSVFERRYLPADCTGFTYSARLTTVEEEVYGKYDQDADGNYDRDDDDDEDADEGILVQDEDTGEGEDEAEVFDLSPGEEVWWRKSAVINHDGSSDDDWEYAKCKVLEIQQEG